MLDSNKLVFWTILVLTYFQNSQGTHEQDEFNRIQFEAAFQGECGHGSPCEQLCYELHDGMYECDCRQDFVLREDGYSCAEINSTVVPSTSPQTKVNYSDVLYQKDAVLDISEIDENVTLADSNDIPNVEISDITSQGPSLEQKLTEVSSDDEKRTTASISTTGPCILDCGLGGLCVRSNARAKQTCLCPLGRGGDFCKEDIDVRSPRFQGSSWLAFSALRGAYKHVQLALELRPEAYDGVILLTGERDDMVGDFMALLLHQGRVEFRFDCGSGEGVVRSEETVLLNQWNHVTLFRHRWDAWLQLNGERHAQGRSKGLFSRITFREPVFIGGPGNTTNIAEKLPVVSGFKGCIRHLEINDHIYNFGLEPKGEAIKGLGIEECTADRCSRVPCQHGGKCLTGPESAVCLCPLGFSGDLCEIRVDLQVPAFNGSSHLRYKGLGEEALTWLDLEITFKPNAPDGLLIYNGHRTDGYGDFMALYLVEEYVEFAFDLGTGASVVTSKYQITLGEWHKVRISRTGRQAILFVDKQPSVETTSPGAFTQLSLPQNLFLGGVVNFGAVSPHIKVRSSFIGCVQALRIGGRQIPILAEALGGANVNNCPHPCVAKPCGEDGECIPEMDYFTCRCKPGHRNQACSRGPPSFSGIDSYLYFNDARTLDSLMADPITLNVRFKSTSSDGLLLWLNNGLGGGFISVGLEKGDLVLRFSNRNEEVVVVHNNTYVHDNLWHRIKAVRDGGTGLLIVDNGPAVTHQAVAVWRRPRPPSPDEEGLFVGGMPHTLLLRTIYRTGIKGCVADIVINADYHLRLVGDRDRNVRECDS
ncbi:pikachurin [Coccinella septempunctata]|uniref:pikachurin n=1 Tax=Coccinella septempunctata TaxID=41139 RepID=UPI001D06DAAB|nr:pikachurin [Coccinella septempunctata]